jgi:hypothetical protein
MPQLVDASDISSVASDEIEIEIDDSHIIDNTDLWLVFYLSW